MKNKKVLSMLFFVALFSSMLIGQKVFAASCQGSEKCMKLEQQSPGSDTYYNPTGFKCVARGACPGQVGSADYQECCAPIASSSSSSSTTSANGTSFINPLAFKTVEGFLGGIMSAIQKIIVVLALVFIMIGAVMILASAGNSGMVEKGKAAITMALIGLALGIAAPSLLKELSSILGWGEGSRIAALTLSEIAVRVLNFLLGTMGIVALIMLVIGAIMYLTSAGDEDRIDKGKEIFKYSLLGVVMAMASMVLVTQIARFFQ